jgi:hypothetical protein
MVYSTMRLLNSNTNISRENNRDFSPKDKFFGCLPLKHLFGFCEDYKKIMLNCNQQLILNRSSTDLDALYVKEVADNTVSTKIHY